MKGWLGSALKALAAIVGGLLCIVILMVGCGWLRRYTTTDADLAAHLLLEFGAEADAMYTGLISFGLRSEANEHLSFVGRRIVVECNGKVIPTPDWSGALRDSIGSGSRQVRYWHMQNFELESWLGGPGEYELRAAIGPVFSNKIRITLPGPVIQSPTIDHIAR